MQITELKIRDFDPVFFFLKMNDETGVSFLHTGRNTEGERWSIIAWDPSGHAESFDDLRRRKRTESCGIPFCGGEVGYFSYDLGYDLFEIKKTATDDLGMPLISANYYEKFLCFDNEERTLFTSVPHEVVDIWSRDLPAIRDSFDLKFVPDMSEDYYNQAFARIKEYILDGDIYQVNLTHRLVADFDGDYRALFAKICGVNPAPFSAYLEGEGFHILSASPERFLKLNGDIVQTCPTKGTRPRGQTPPQDEMLKQDLMESEKEAAELSMITDLLRNDIGQVCKIGSVQVVSHRAIQACPTVWHTYSLVEGVLRDDLDAVDLLKACIPGGSITGCPKKRSMEIIDELEPVCRGPYTGAIGYLSNCGNMDTSIVIRTLIAKGGKLYLNVGGGIVADSENDAEYQETLDKAKSFLNL